MNEILTWTVNEHLSPLNIWHGLYGISHLHGCESVCVSWVSVWAACLHFQLFAGWSRSSVCSISTIKTPTNDSHQPFNCSLSAINSCTYFLNLVCVNVVQWTETAEGHSFIKAEPPWFNWPMAPSCGPAKELPMSSLMVGRRKGHCD